MSAELTTLARAIAIRPEFVANRDTNFRIRQHGKSLSSCMFTIFQPGEKPEAGNFSSPARSLLHVNGKAGLLNTRRCFSDTSGLPLFDLYRNSAGSTWYVELPGDSRSTIVRLSRRASALKDKLEVSLKNAAADGEETILHVHGQDVWKQCTNVYLDDKLVMTAKRVGKWSIYLPRKNLEWMVDIASGMDMALASVIVVVLAANMYDSSMQSSSLS